MQNDTSRKFPNLLGEMLKAGMDKKDLAEHLGISRRTLDRRLNGSIEFRWKELQILHSLFSSVPMRVLLERSKQPSTQIGREEFLCQKTDTANTADAKRQTRKTCAIHASKSSGSSER